MGLPSNIQSPTLQMEEGANNRSRLEQLTVSEMSQTHSPLKHRNLLVVGLGITIGIIITGCSLVTILWAISRPNQPIIRVPPGKVHQDVQYAIDSSGNKVCLSQHCVVTAASILSNMDTSTEPCIDFYQYACGKWAKNYPIPEDKSSYDTFSKVRDDLQLVLKDVLSRPVMEEEDSNSTRNAKLLFESCMNETIIEQRGAEPLLTLIRELGGWPVLDASWNESNFDVSELMGKLKAYNNDIMVSEWIAADSHNSSINTIQIDQPTLALHNRDYYIQGENKAISAYFKFMIEVTMLLGEEQMQESSAADLSDIIEFEKRVANLTEPREKRRNQTHNKITLGELQEIIPQINWNTYFSTFSPNEMNNSEEITVLGMPFLENLGRLLDETPKRVVANYLMWRFINNRVNSLDRRFTQKKQDLYQVLYGRQKEPERWKTCTDYVNAVMGMAAGALFVNTSFSKYGKKDTEEMIESIQNAFVDLLGGLEWMDEETKAVAIAKASMIDKKIGYPEYIMDKEELDKDYEGMDFNPTTYFENVLQKLRHLAKWEQEQLRQPVNKTLWSTAPVIANAFYSKSKNQILLPAGILRPPFYHSENPKSMNYGGIGVVIGHEIIHAFDDRGRQYDIDGNLRLWWSESAINWFHRKAQCFIDQYSSYTDPMLGLNVNGIITQGENIADNGGIKHAFRAYRKWAEKNEPEPLLPGLNLTQNQLFFLNFAQVWCSHSTPESAAAKIRQEPHSPGRFRVIGTLSNSDDFSQAYKCSQGSPMNPSPERKCSLW